MTHPIHDQQEYLLHNQRLLCKFSKDHPGELIELTDKHGHGSLLETSDYFCTLSINGMEYQPKQAKIISPTEVLFQWAQLPTAISAELLLTLADSSLEWRLSMAGESSACYVCFPFLNLITLDDAKAPTKAVSEDAFLDKQGRFIFRHVDWPFPIVWQDSNGRALTFIIKAIDAASQFSSRLLLEAPGVNLTLQPEKQVVLQAELSLHQGGWRAAFDRYRTHIRTTFDLSEYQRKDFTWYQDQLVQHFTFLYGREILNLDKGEFELERFLDEGEENFGGYSGFLIWGVYPRIGVDERTQWDFYDDLPGGRVALREMARRARERGVRFFIPYKPWDRSAQLHGHETEPDYKLLAQLVEDLEADGVFLDTMSAIDQDFRAMIDQVRPGVVFCSEGRAKGDAFELITGSWDQSPNRDPAQGNWSASAEKMPGVDLWRFIFPEHRLFVVNRHAVGDDRIRIIQRGFFSGMGWVVWQDIFGLVLTYAPDEARLLKKCAAIAQEHRQVLSSPQPTPLINTLMPNVYANEFPVEEKRFWTLYNENEERVGGPLIQVEPRAGYHFVDVWNNAEVKVDADGRLHLALAPQAVGAIAELPQLLQYDSQSRRIQVALNHQMPNATMQISRLEGEVISLPVEQVLDLQTLPALRQGRYLIRLMANGELLDQLVILETEEESA